MVVVSSPTDVRHDGISLLAEGIVSLQLSAKTIGIFEAFYNSVKVRLVTSVTWLVSQGGGWLNECRNLTCTI